MLRQPASSSTTSAFSDDLIDVARLGTERAEEVAEDETVPRRVAVG